MKILGIDYGRKHIGLAVTDDDGRMAFPFKTIEVISRKQLFDELERIVEFEGIVQVVVGLPLTMRGEEGRAATEVQKFVCDLEEFLNVPVDSVDERLSSAEARKSGTGKKENEHAIAAQKILQAYLESREHKG
ncbi:hypothetical protein A3J43_03170 [Candidatus Uhrbacteria bacterium RIFCSPHIGHO2_12_FULL_54_23]|uniref:Putative pre-16S rRNA nuclease n=2 Tax=Candidatus Uhriibacteriota TaxID=1752732 RepID=A0A1F7UK69_9BACT|nr:MAG: hypothetical protein A3J43_03170 [Candidatus Uhrbacteria bacterium RIFCSPHIGHO2_12_FULL_54_23]OGL90706.1 MAG: hypothetical protein A3J36_02525 [Candidatus Uhrbacteria bacterium RIFCSPLOWO2_02_FULL_54_37]